MKKSDDYDAFKDGVKLEDWRDSDKTTLAEIMRRFDPSKLEKPNVSGTKMYLSVSKIGRYLYPLDETDDDYLHTEDSFENKSESIIDAEDMLTNKAAEPRQQKVNHSEKVLCRDIQLVKN